MKFTYKFFMSLFICCLFWGADSLAMVVQHNISAMNTNSNLNKLNNIQKLSHATDDASGLQISEKMRNALKDTSNVEKFIVSKEVMGDCGLRNIEQEKFKECCMGKAQRVYAESKIRDTDMAAEMMQYTKNNILAQAGAAMLEKYRQEQDKNNANRYYH